MLSEMCGKFKTLDPVRNLLYIQDTLMEKRSMAVDSSSLANEILARASSGTAAVWTASDFLDLGSRAAVDKALQRLAAAGSLRRIDRGLYDRPRINGLTGNAAAPDPRAIVDAITRRDHIRVLVDGVTAANDLGLTTAVPAKITVLTDARLRPITLGNQEIKFKQVAPSRLFWAGRPAMRVVQALHWLHDVLQSDDRTIIKRLRSILADPSHGGAIRDDLRAGLSAMPIWMQGIVRGLLDESHDDGRTRKGAPRKLTPGPQA